jgi:anaerobic magnesium-protoporphyrin IX monomethyl ester cyclase
MPPLGLAYLAAYLENKGVTAKIIDMQVEHEPFPEMAGKIDFAPDFIGVTATTTIIKDAMALVKTCKKYFPRAKIVMGGVHPTFTPDEILQDQDVDYVIRGEGEESLYRLVSGAAETGIGGLSYRKDGVITHNPDSELIKNLDTLPMPAYHLLRVERYQPSLGSYKRLPAISMITSRGCPGKCTYCFGSYLGGRIRMHSAAYMIEEVKMLVKNYGIREIAFYDDTFTAIKRNVHEFCERIISEKIDITWVAFARVDFIDGETLALMKRAGCHQVLFGIETGNEEILRNIGKVPSLEKAKLAVRMTKKAGIECRTSFMLGNPGETEATLKQTIDYSIALDPDLAMYNVTTPFPGTKMYKWAKENGYLKTEDWSRYDFSTAVMELPTVSGATVEKYYAMAHKAFYGRPGYMLKRLLSIRSIDDIIMAFKAVIAIWFK